MNWDGRTPSGPGGIKPGSTVIVGTAPSASTKMTLQSFPVTASFSSSIANVSFPNAFPNGVQCVWVGSGSSTAPYFIANINSSTSLTGTQIALWTSAGGAFTGSVPVNVIAIGW